MSYLRLYNPDVEDEAADVDDEPCVLSFEEFAATWKRPGAVLRRDDAHSPDAAARRARVVYANRRCPYCKHPLVEPVELADARLNRNRHVVPATATLVGFHCDGCCREWPA